MRILTYIWQLVSLIQRTIALTGIRVIVRLIKIFDEDVILYEYHKHGPNDQ